MYASILRSSSVSLSLRSATVALSCTLTQLENTVNTLPNERNCMTNQLSVHAVIIANELSHLRLQVQVYMYVIFVDEECLAVLALLLAMDTQDINTSH